MKLKFTLSVLILTCLMFFNAMAAAPQTQTLPIDTGLVILLAVGLGIGVKVISKKLKQVDKALEDAFGEKIL